MILSGICEVEKTQPRITLFPVHKQINTSGNHSDLKQATTCQIDKMEQSRGESILLVKDQ